MAGGFGGFEGGGFTVGGEDPGGALVGKEVVDVLVGADEFLHAEQGCAGPTPLERVVLVLEGVGDEIEEGFVVDVGAVVVTFGGVAEGVEGEFADGAARAFEEGEIVLFEEGGGAGGSPQVAGGDFGEFCEFRGDRSHEDGTRAVAGEVDLDVRVCR